MVNLVNQLLVVLVVLAAIWRRGFCCDVLSRPDDHDDPQGPGSSWYTVRNQVPQNQRSKGFEMNAMIMIYHDTSCLYHRRYQTSKLIGLELGCWFSRGATSAIGSTESPQRTKLADWGSKVLKHGKPVPE